MPAKREQGGDILPVHGDKGGAVHQAQIAPVGAQKGGHGFPVQVFVGNCLLFFFCQFFFQHNNRHGKIYFIAFIG